MQEAQRLVADSAVEGDLRTMTLLGAIYKTRGQVYERRGENEAADQCWERAGDVFKRLNARAPDDPSIRVGVGNVLDHRRELEGALDEYEAALGVAPNYTAAANDAAIVSTRLIHQDPENAASWQAKACEYREKAIVLSKSEPQFDDRYRNQARRQMARA